MLSGPSGALYQAVLKTLGLKNLEPLLERMAAAPFRLLALQYHEVNGRDRMFLLDMDRSMLVEYVPELTTRRFAMPLPS